MENDTDNDVENLLTELQEVKTKYKAGSIERENKEDEIYTRLNEIAQRIQGNNDSKMKQLYVLITEKPVVTEVQRVPVYTDEFKMFTQSPRHVKVQMFLRRMVNDLKVMNEGEMDKIMKDHTQDGPKLVLEKMVDSCSREQYLNVGKEKMCRRCMHKVYSSVFYMLAENLTLDLKRRLYQIREMYEHNDLSELDTQDLQVYVSKVLKKLHKLIAKSFTRKKDWVFLIESVFRLSVGLVNELMMKFVSTQKARQEM